ncbi:MAG: hypothetical protein WCJ52_01580 [Phenylobacterium sp.]|uniref:hypothetical protein n=1 Tax=Phenylobacterium sp. TaxID=1871053 RepID=UPI00301ACB10
MKPDIPAVLAELAGLVARNAAPDLDPAERAGALSLSAALLGMAAEAWDGAAQRLVEENRALRALLADAGDYTGPDAALAGAEDSDLTISVLSAANARLRAGLIALQADVEAEDSPEARALESRIWQELRLSTDRRRMSSALA